MKNFRAIFPWFRGLAGVAIVAGVAAVLAPPAFAGRCPSGQILQVSKNACIDKAEAVKLGILHGAAPKDAPKEKPAASQPAEDAPSPDATAQQPEPQQPPPKAPPKHATHSIKISKPAPDAAASAPPPKAEPAPLAPPASPYGALSLDSFQKP